MSQPGWVVPSWELQLVIPGTGVTGSYNAPSLGCSGTLRISGTGTSTMTAHIKTTSPVYPGCDKGANLTLSLAGAGQGDLTWTPASILRPPGTAVLSPG